ncbi:MAG TPA: hypothetical protein VD905_14520 [Flavobacteriales bacterium]|nr:hypothetical protein [Flavobacteriales bacterium]
MKGVFQNMYFVLVLFFIGLSCRQAVTESEKNSREKGFFYPKLKCHLALSPKQLEQDFTILITTLEQAHPGIYRVTSKKEIDRYVNSVRKEIKTGKTYLEFLRLLAPLFTKIGCINTQWSHSPAFIQFRNNSVPMFPLKLEIKQEKFYVKANLSGLAEPAPGSEILEINNEKVTDYLKKNYELLPVEGNMHEIQQQWLAAYFAQHHSNFWEQCDTFRLKLKSATNQVFMVNLPALLKKDMKDIPVSGGNRYPGSINETIFTINFGNKRFNGNEKLFNAFVDSCFNEFQKKQPENMLIDLGDSNLENVFFALKLYSYFDDRPIHIEEEEYRDVSNIKYDQFVKQFPAVDPYAINRRTMAMNKSFAFSGNLYVCVSAWNQDAAGLFCALLGLRKNTFFIGQECNAPYGINTYPLLLELPNSGITVRIPTVQLTVSKKLKTELGGIKTSCSFDEFYNYLTIKQNIKIKEQ